MIVVYILIVFIAILGAPLFTVIASTAILNFYNSGTSILIVPQEIAGIADTPLLHSIPLFTFAGYLLAHSKASQRLVKLTKATLGWMPGGLAIVTLLTCSVFTAFTGASGVTIVALGGLLLPALLSEKYGEKYSLGLVTASGSVGLLFPPSLPIIIFGVVSGVIIDDLFLAGIIPGLLLIFVLSSHAMFMSSKFKVKKTKFSWKELGATLWNPEPKIEPEISFGEKIKKVIAKIQFWELPLPIFLFAGIYSGKLVISDAATFTVIYLLIVELFLTKDIKIKELPKIMKESMLLVGAILIILSVSLAATNYIIDAQVPQKIFNVIQTFITNKWIFLILLNILLLIVGCIMDIFSALVVVVPLILPIAQAYNINLVHLGIIFLANLEIGYLTPPVGMNLFISSIRFNKPVISLYRASLIFIGLLMIALMLITYVPGLSTWFLDKPSIVGKWEYQYDDGNVDQISIKSNGKYLRRKGDILALMMDDPYYGKYEIKKNVLILFNDDGKEEYKYEVFKDGKELLLDNLNKQEMKAVNDLLKDSDPALLKKGIKGQNRMFYKNTVSTPINEKTGKFIGKWENNQGFIEFHFNGLCTWLNENGEKKYRYIMDSKKKLTLIEYNEDAEQNIENKKIFNYKFTEDSKLILTNKIESFSFVFTDSISDE